MVRKHNNKISCIFFWHETKWTQGQEWKFLFLSPTAYVWSISLYAYVRVYFSPPLVRRFFRYIITISWKHIGSCDSLTYTILSFSNKRHWKMSAEENPDRLIGETQSPPLSDLSQFVCFITFGVLSPASWAAQYTYFHALCCPHLKPNFLLCNYLIFRDSVPSSAPWILLFTPYPLPFTGCSPVCSPQRHILATW